MTNEKLAAYAAGAACPHVDVMAMAHELTQLCGNLSLAEEGLANYALEVQRLRTALRDCVEYIELDSERPHFLFGAKALLPESSHEPSEQLSPSEVASFNKTLARSPRRIEPCEQRCDFVGMYDGQCGLDLGHAGEHRLFGPHRGAVKSRAAPKCGWGGAFGYCVLEPGHDGVHQLPNQPAQKLSDVEVLRGQESAINDLLAGTKRTK